MRHVRLVTAVAGVSAVLLAAGTVAALGHPARAVPHQAAPLRAAAAAVATTTSTTGPPPQATTTTAQARVPVTAAVTAPADPNRRWAVGVATYTFVDPTRRTPPAGHDPGEASRTLPTIVRYPIPGSASAQETPGAVPSRAGGPFPLIVFAHGYDSSPAVYAALLHAWAGAGYVVAAPAFPRATAGGPLDEADLDSQPADLSFVISRLLAPGPLIGTINAARIGLAGHSDGGDAALGTGGDTCCWDRRVSAVAAAGVDEHGYPGGTYFPAGSPPLLVMQADHDVFNPPASGLKVFADANSPKYFLWLVNATHLESVTTDLAHLGVVEAATTAFFDRYLKGMSDGVRRLEQVAAAGPALARLTAG